MVIIRSGFKRRADKDQRLVLGEALRIEPVKEESLSGGELHARQIIEAAKEIFGGKVVKEEDVF